LQQDLITRRAPSGRFLPLLAAALSLVALPARASLFSGDTLDAVANGIAWFVLCVVPIGGIALFWIVHVMPEKIAHKRHHPQAEAIHTLCLLSLFFGGLLWPIAWLWAYSRPVGYRLAYGTDKHESYHLAMAVKAREGKLSETELAHLREELDAMQVRGALPRELSSLRAELDARPLRTAPGAEGTA
jgi:CBS domain containing-hemolysin-like protein